MREFFNLEKTAFLYKAFGMQFGSDIPLKALLPGDANNNIDLVIHSGEIVAPSNGSDFTNYLVQGSAQQLLINIPKVGRFLVQQGRQIIYHRYAGVDNEMLGLFLLGFCMGAVLQQRGYIVLHGNAVSTDGKFCTVFVGNSGAGKSTAAAYYFKQGAYILADDVAAITFNAQGLPVVIPAYPQIKLWQDSADLVGIATQDLKRLRSESSKFACRVDEQFCAHPLHLKQVIELEAGDSKQMVGTEKLTCLIRHSYRYNFVHAMGLWGQYGKQLLRLINQVEVMTMDRTNLINAH